jgi:hypothetical protein
MFPEKNAELQTLLKCKSVLDQRKCENVTSFCLHLKGFITQKLIVLCLSKLVVFGQIIVLSFLKLAFLLNFVTASTVALYFLPFVSLFLSIFVSFHLFFILSTFFFFL